MKKVNIIISSLLITLLITGCGCGKNNKNSDIDKQAKVNKELYEEINKLEIFEGLEILNDNTLETQLGINRNYVEEHTIGINIYSSEPKIYIIIKPKLENKELVKEAIELYINRRKQECTNENKKKFDNILKQEYKDYYIYVVSDNNEEVFQIVKGYLDK